jgi:hypothetical protein
MHGDAKYKNLQTTNFYAKHIIADEITLQDVNIKSDQQMAGATVKKLYENQRNTNVFDDFAKSTLESLNTCMPKNSQNLHMFKLPLISEVNVDSIPHQHTLMCFDNNGNVIYICNFNDKIKYFSLPMSEPYVKVSLNIDSDDETPRIKLDVI